MRIEIGKLSKKHNQSEYSGGWSQEVAPLLSQQEFDTIKQQLNTSAKKNQSNYIGLGVGAVIVLVVLVVLMVTRSKSKDYNPTPFYIAFFVLIGLCIGGMFIKKGQEKQVTARVHALNQEYKHRYIVLEEEAVLSHSKTFNGHTTKYYDRFVHIYCTVAIAQVAPVYPPQPVSPVYSPHPVGQGYVQPVAQGYTQQMGQYPPVSQRYAEYPNQGYAQPVQQPVADLEKGNRQ